MKIIIYIKNKINKIETIAPLIFSLFLFPVFKPKVYDNKIPPIKPPTCAITSILGDKKPNTKFISIVGITLLDKNDEIVAL